MMAQCPNCSQTIAITEDHFGTLYRCEHCKAEFFIGFDGVPENSKEAVPENQASPAVTSEPKVALTSGLPEIPAVPEAAGGNVKDIFNIDNAPHSMGVSLEPAQTIGSGEAFKNFTEDVETFGNEVSLSGVLTFDIEISGIDLAELKSELLDALEDSRFGWNLDDIKESIKDGTLILKKISAPKMIVLVKRITPIGLNLNWRHHVATQ